MVAAKRLEDQEAAEQLVGEGELALAGPDEGAGEDLVDDADLCLQAREVFFAGPPNLVQGEPGCQLLVHRQRELPQGVADGSGRSSAGELPPDEA